MTESLDNDLSGDSRTEASRFLSAAAVEVRSLREQADRAARAVTAAVPGSSSTGEAAIIAGLARSLTTRTGELAAECRDLEGLIDRVGAAYREVEQQAAQRADGDGEAQPADQDAEAGRAEEGTEARLTTDIADAARPAEGEPLQEPTGDSSPGPVVAVPAGQQPWPRATPAVPTPAQPDAASGQAQDTAVAADDRTPPVAPDGGTVITGDKGISEGVKLLVTQMAVAGAGRAEIERRLVADFGIAEPAAVLADLFGSR